jgi:hypothetical protein
MNPSVKYTLGRLGLFLAVFGALWPVPLHPLVKLMIAVLVSAVLALFLLRGWRDEMAESLAASARRRRAERERLRAALAGDDTTSGDDTGSRDTGSRDTAAGGVGDKAGGRPA